MVLNETPIFIAKLFMDTGLPIFAGKIEKKEAWLPISRIQLIPPIKKTRLGLQELEDGFSVCK